MNTINLYEYIRHGMILKNLTENDLYDAVIYESFDNTKIEIPTTPTFHKLQHPASHLISGELSAYIERYDRILIILDSTPLHYLIPFLLTQDPTNDKKKITLINLGTGISGSLYKGSPEYHDIGIATEFGLDIREAFDFVSMFKLLQHTGISYIRVPAGELVGNLLSGQDIDITSGIIDLTGYELTGSTGTILCPGSSIAHMISASQIMEQTGHTYDVFMLTKYSTTISPALQTSLQQTEKLILLLDQSPTSTYIAQIQAELSMVGLFETEIQVITPQDTAAIVTDVAQLYQASKYDAIGIAQQIMGIEE